MDGYAISRTAERSGFTPSALRFYEREGLVRPARTATGYRSYSEADIATLRFIARAKDLGLALARIAGLVPLFRGERCAPVQDRLRDLVDARIAEAEARASELAAFTAALRRASGALQAHPPDGPCDDTCACIAAGAGAEAEGPAVVCTLGAGEREGRAAAWRAAIGAASGRQPTAAGVRLRFDRGIDVAALAALAAAENDCCRWATFAITIGPGEVTLDVSGSAAAQAAIARMYRAA